LCSYLWAADEGSSDKKAYAEIRSWYKKNKDKPLIFYPYTKSESLKKRTILQIILIRHGNPEINRNGWFSYKAARNYIIAYDTVGVKPIVKPPVVLETGEEVKIFSSSLFRAFDTALKVFGDDVSITVDSAFIEFQREITPLPLILPIKGWTGISRFFWMIGLHSSDIPSLRSEKSRAVFDSELLENAAIDNTRVVLVAHGFLNKYIIRNLKKNGWDHSYNGGNDYLAVQVLTKIE
jgi:broad specificity phosphatase PhoE